MIENYFSVPIYFNNLKGDRIKFEKEIDDYINQHRLQNKWQPDNDTALTSFVPGQENNFLKNSYLKHLIYDHAERYLDEADQKYIKESLKIDNSWLNIFEKGQLIGYHDHGYQPNTISGVYYFRTPLNCGRIIFKSSNPFAVSFPHNSSKYANLITCDVEEDMIILFPSWLSHKVEPNKNKDLRISIAFNISFDYCFYKEQYAS